MNNIIVVDIRERDLMKEMDDIGIPYEKMALDVGDVLIGDSLVIERKTVSDLVSSIKDGRNREQGQRLQASSRKVVYAIEGSMSYDDAAATRGIRNSALVTFALLPGLCDWGHLVVNTATTRQTAHLVAALKARLERVERGERRGGESCEARAYEPNVIKTCRRENVTRSTVFFTQLAAVPHLGLKTAKAIAAALSVDSMSGLIRAIERDPNVLQTVPGVGRVIAASLASFLGVCDRNVTNGCIINQKMNAHRKTMTVENYSTKTNTTLLDDMTTQKTFISKTVTTAETNQTETNKPQKN